LDQGTLFQNPLDHLVHHGVEILDLLFPHKVLPWPDEGRQDRNSMDPGLNGTDWLDVLREHEVHLDSPQEILRDGLQM